MNVTVAAVTNNSVKVTWIPPSNPNGVIRYYEIGYNGESKKHVIDSSKPTEVNLILILLFDKIIAYR